MSFGLLLRENPAYCIVFSDVTWSTAHLVKALDFLGLYLHILAAHMALRSAEVRTDVASSYVQMSLSSGCSKEKHNLNKIFWKNPSF